MNDPAQPHAPEPPPARDPYVIGFVLLLAITLVAGLALGVQAYLSHEPSQPGSSGWDGALTRLADTLKQAARGVHEKTREVAGGRRAESADPATPATKAMAAPGTDPGRDYPDIQTPPPPPHVRPVPADGSWTYAVHFGPRWQSGGQLHYATRRGGSGSLQASMSWQPHGGQRSTWDFGTVAAGHPSHANTRFPGFFMHAAYLPAHLEPGARLQWDFPWQGGPGASGRMDRVRRFEMRMTGWEKVRVPAGEFAAARLDGTLRYLDQGNSHAQVRYVLWYAPAARQTVRVLWLGRAPDEGSGEMIAELATARLP